MCLRGALCLVIRNAETSAATQRRAASCATAPALQPLNSTSCRATPECSRPPRPVHSPQTPAQARHAAPAAAAARTSFASSNASVSPYRRTPRLQSLWAKLGCSRRRRRRAWLRLAALPPPHAAARAAPPPRSGWRRRRRRQSAASGPRPAPHRHQPPTARRTPRSEPCAPKRSAAAPRSPPAAAARHAHGCAHTQTEAQQHRPSRTSFTAGRSLAVISVSRSAASRARKSGRAQLRWGGREGGRRDRPLQRWAQAGVAAAERRRPCSSSRAAVAPDTRAQHTPAQRGRSPPPPCTRLPGRTRGPPAGSQMPFTRTHSAVNARSQALKRPARPSDAHAARSARTHCRAVGSTGQGCCSGATGGCR
jgi:hypothetical protein